MNAVLDLECRDSIDRPAEFFANARRAGGDVQWSDVHRAWVILSHSGVEEGFRDTERLSSDKTGAFARVAATRSPAFTKVVELLSGWMNFRDPPAHTRLREPVRRAFTPRAIEALEPEVSRIIDSVIDAFPSRRVDLTRDFARIVPALVIAAILGVDADDRGRFQGWSDQLGRLVFSMTPGRVDEAPVLAATDEFSAFFRERIELERRAPSGSLLSTIVDAGTNELSAGELVGACTLLLFGGHETTTTAMSNAFALLLERPDLADQLRRNPEAVGLAVEEMIRVGGSARSLPRKVVVDHERGGHRLKPGENVYLCVAAANHDERVFSDAASVDLRRDPNPHLGFGWGLHYCLGAPLARLEIRLAVRALLARFTVLEPAEPIPAVRASAMGFGRRPLVTVAY